MQINMARPKVGAMVPVNAITCASVPVSMVALLLVRRHPVALRQIGPAAPRARRMASISVE
jgi:hypothetical protein